MSLIGNPDTPTSYVADYMQACVGMFGIPAGGFTDTLEAFGAATDWNVESLYAAMLNSSIGRSIFAPGVSNETFATTLVGKLGGSLLADATEAAAIDALKAALDGGMSQAAVAMAAVEYVAALDTSDADFGAVAQQFQNRVTIANYYTFSSTSPATSLTTLTGILSGVSNTTDVTDPAAVIEDQNPGSSGQTYTLTTATDTLVGTTGADTFVATSASTSATYTAADSLSGGDGVDILNLTVDANAAASIPALVVTGIETINVRNVSGNAQTIDAGNFSGSTSINSNLSSTNAILTMSNLSTQQVGIIGNGVVTNGAVTAAYKATATSATVNLQDGTDGTNSDLVITGTGITSTTINSTGANNALKSVQTAATNKTLTINATTGFSAGSGITVGAETGYVVTGAASTGKANTAASNGVDAAVQIGTVVATAKSIDASAMTNGGVAVTLVAAVTSFKGGAGTDEVTTGTSLTSTTASQINANAGTDTLIVTATTDVDTATEAAQYANFERLDVVATTADMALFTNSTFTSVMVGGNATINNMTATQAGDVTIYANASGTFNVKDATTVGNLNTLGLTVSDALSAKNTITLADITAAGVETINIVATDHVTVSALTGATALTTMGITGAGNVSVTSGALALNVNSTVNASAVTGTVGLDFSLATTNGISLTGSSTGVNTITGTSKADVIVGGSAADSITGGDGQDTMTGGAGQDTFKFGVASMDATPSGTVFETITDYTKGTGGDIIDETVGALVIVSGSTAASGTAAIASTGLATFNTADNTLALRVTAVEAGINASGAAAVRQMAFFEFGSDSYVFVSDGTDGLAATDILIKLTGVTGLTGSDLTTSSGNLILS